MNDGLAYTVDRSWAQYSGNSEGELMSQRKYHLDRGNTSAKCSPWILLNAMPGDGRGEDPTTCTREELCKRCWPTMPVSTSRGSATDRSES